MILNQETQWSDMLADLLRGVIESLRRNFARFNNILAVN